MVAPLFISYRREDSAHAAQALHIQLGAYFGEDRVFMDVNSVHPSQRYPDRIRAALEGSAAVAVLIGPGWLFAHDKYGRRRIDQKTDWVRFEIRTAIEMKKPIYPIVLDTIMPPAEALPSDICELCLRQVVPLSRDTWRSAVRSFALTLEHDGLLPSPTVNWHNVPYPNPDIARLPGLSELELEQALIDLDSWEPTRESLLSEYPHERQELRRHFRFRDFNTAMAFMQEAAALFDKVGHHPRWSNEWKAVSIRLTTWDAGNKITALDVQAAKMIDSLASDFRARNTKGRGSPPAS